MEHELTFPVNKLSSRPNHAPGPGGALNAGYTPVDALARVCNTLGQHGLVYDKDFTWHRFDYSIESGFKQYVQLTFKDKDAMLTAKLAVESLK